jgi:TetR/AcrR family transcriptional regulator
MPVARRPRKSAEPPENDVKKIPGSTRDAILAAAASAFAARGFSATSVDSIARASGFNKAMIYYHFRHKKGLYVEILRSGFRHMGSRAAEIAGSDLPPAAKIEAFIDAFDAFAASRPYMPPIMMREMAEGAVHLDSDTLGLMAVIFENLASILKEGADRGVFRPAHPVLTYFTLISPIIFFRATAPIRAALGKSHVPDVRAVDSAAFVANLKSTALTVLTAGATAPAPARSPRARSRATRPGDHA